MRVSTDVRVRIIKIGIVLIATLGAASATFYYRRPLAETAGIASFFSFVLLTLVDYGFDRELALALYRSFKVLVLLLMLAAFLAGVVSLFSFDGISSAHSDPKIKSAVVRHVFQIRASFAALLTALLVASGYALWKFKATRFAEGRIGLLKDLTLQIRQLLLSKTISMQDRREQGLQLCLSSLLAALELSPWQ